MYSFLSILAQTDTGSAGADGETGGIMLVGFIFVLLVLTLLAAVTSIIGMFFSRQAAKDAAVAAKAASAAASPAAVPPTPVGEASPSEGEAATFDPANDPQIQAVIAAAIHSVFGDRPHRVVAVRSAAAGWAQEGRRQIFSSHRVR